MSDQELLELAAKAAGLRINFHPTASYQWNPLARNDDALRLAVKLTLQIDVMPSGEVFVGYGKTKDRSLQRVNEVREENTDSIAATRRAIVRAAAAIGKAMK